MVEVGTWKGSFDLLLLQHQSLSLSLGDRDREWGNFYGWIFLYIINNNNVYGLIGQIILKFSDSFGEGNDAKSHVFLRANFRWGR